MEFLSAHQWNMQSTLTSMVSFVELGNKSTNEVLIEKIFEQKVGFGKFTFCEKYSFHNKHKQTFVKSRVI